MKHAFIALAASGLLAALSAQQPRPFDLLITNARIVDGTGGPSRHGSVAVKDGRIVDVGGAAGQLARARFSWAIS